MKVMNIGGKVVSIGNVIILPGETKPVPDSYAGNAAVDCLVEHKNIRLIQDEEKEPPASQGQTGEDKSGEEEDGGGKKPLSRMNKQELTEECLKLGLDILEDDTKETLAEKIRAATAE